MQAKTFLLQVRSSQGFGAGQGIGALAQHAFRHIPPETGVGDRNAIAQRRGLNREGLITFVEIAFHHHANERTSAGGTLRYDAVPDLFLARVLLAGVGVTAIDHEDGRKTGLSQFRFRSPDAVPVIIGLQPTAAQHDVAVKEVMAAAIAAWRNR